MTIISTFTNIGLDKARETVGNLGFVIRPVTFAVSSTATPGGIPALQLLTQPNANVFFTGAVSSAVPVAGNIYQVSAVIPPGQTLAQTAINEIYILSLDVDDNIFLLAAGQPQVGSNILYDPTGTTTLLLQLQLTNADITDFLQFDYTQAYEIAQHNIDPNAHPYIESALALAGVFVQPASHEFVGQNYDQFPTFAADVVDGDLVYKDVDSVYKQAMANGTYTEEVAGIAKISIAPTSNYVSVTSNAGQPVLNVESTLNLVVGEQLSVGFGTARSESIIIQSVGTTQVVVISIATPAVFTAVAHGLVADQAVYLSTTGMLPTGFTAGTIYYVLYLTANTFSLSATPSGAAINTSGTQTGIQTVNAAQITATTNLLFTHSVPQPFQTNPDPVAVQIGEVAVGGIVGKSHGYPILTRLYLHPTNPGQVTDIPSDIPVGLALSTTYMALRVSEPSQVADYVDAVVSSVPGYKHFTDAQAAIDSVPSGGWVRFDENYLLTSSVPLSNNGQPVNLLFTGTSSGLEYFVGQDEVELIAFSAVPTAGDYVLVWNGPSNRSSRLAYNAPATGAGSVQAAIEAMPGTPTVAVSGNYSSGFTVEFTGPSGLQPQNLISVGLYPGNDEIQLLDFNQTSFSGGSFQLVFGGYTTGSIAFNQVTASVIQSQLNSLTSIGASGCVVTLVGSPPSGHTQFTVEFVGVNGLKPQALITSTANSLTPSTTITVTHQVPGMLPDNRLTASSAPVTSTATQTQLGMTHGSSTALILDSPGCQVIGLGRIYGFTLGIELNVQPDTRIEMFFDPSTTTGIDATGLTDAQYNIDGSIGLPFSLDAETSFRNLAKVMAQPIPDFTTLVTPAYVTLGDGSQQGLVAGRTISNFTGATINWSTGVVTGGNNFVPFTPLNPSDYYMYAVILKTDGTLGIISPVGENAAAGLAPAPTISGGVLRATVLIQGNGAGGIEPVEPSAIRNFYESGAVNFDVTEVEFDIVTNGGQTVFDISSLTLLEFQNNNTIFDIDVHISGQYQAQDPTGLLTNPNYDYKKISSTAIQFAVAPVSGVLEFKLRTSDTMSFAQNGSEVGQLVAYFTGNGSQSDFDFSTSTPQLSWNVSNTITDVEVYLAGQGQLQDVTGAGIQDFIKLSSTKIRFTKGGSPFPIPNGAILWARTRLFQVGGSNVSVVVTTENHGTPLPSGLAVLDVEGPTLSIVQESPGVHQLVATPQEGSNIGTGQGTVYVGLAGDDMTMQFRNLLAGSGLLVENVGNDILISLSAASYYRQFRTGLTGTNITAAGIYNLGTAELDPYRNGLKLLNSLSVGDPSDQYQENVNMVSIDLQVPATTPDWFAFVNVTTPATWTAIYSGVAYPGATVLTTPNPYVLGSNRIRLWRNGLMCNTAGNGGSSAGYSETDANTLTLSLALGPTDWVLVEYVGSSPIFRDEVANFTGSTLTLPDAYTVGSNHLLVWRNGLLTNDVGYGSAADQYSEVGIPTQASHTITLGQPANLTDFFTIMQIS